MLAAQVGDPRFFAASRPISLAAVAQAAGAALHFPDRVADGLLHGVAPLQSAGRTDLSFLDNRRYLDQLATTAAAAVILQPAMLDRLPPGAAGLVTATPYLAWARACALFHPEPAVRPGIHATAVVGPAARIGAQVQIGPGVVVGAGAAIGDGCVLDAHAVIGAGVVLGQGCRIGAGATISHALLGDRVVVFPGVRIGQDGFGFAPDGVGGYVSVPQLGRVLIGNDVQIGANTTIDRGSMQDTVIGDGCRLDNLVQIGHNVRLGRGCVIVAQVGISGSTTLEDHVMVAGQAGLAGHLHVGRQARIGAQSGVMADIPAGTSVMGSPCQPSRDYFRELAVLRRQARRNPHLPQPAASPPARGTE